MSDILTEHRSFGLIKQIGAIKLCLAQQTGEFNLQNKLVTI